jgi:hypothetical protein
MMRRWETERVSTWKMSAEMMRIKMKEFESLI